MKYSILIFIIFLLGCKTQEVTTNKKIQPNESITEKLCEKFDDNWENQFTLQSEIVLKKTLSKQEDENILNNLNKHNYIITRELWKNCSKYKIKNYSLGSLFTKILDIDNTLLVNQFNELENKIETLEKSKKIQLMIVTIDDLFPYNDVTEYSIEQGNIWKIGYYPKNGGIIIVLDKSDKQIRMSTDNKLRKNLTDNECLQIIETLKPFFKEGKYFEGLTQMINEIEERI